MKARNETTRGIMYVRGADPLIRVSTKQDTVQHESKDRFDEMVMYCIGHIC